MQLPVMSDADIDVATVKPWIGPVGQRMERLELHLTLSLIHI